MRLFSFLRGASADLQLWDSDQMVELSANAVAFVEGQVGICKTAAGEVSEPSASALRNFASTNSTHAPSLVMPQIDVVTDITVLDNKSVEVQTYVPSIPNNIGLRMQYQDLSEW